MAAAEAALFDDLNGPEALAALFDFIRRANAELDRRGGDRESVERARAAFERINGVLDIVPDRADADPELASWIEERIGGAAGGAGASRFRRSGPHPRRADGARRGDRGRGRGDALEAGASDVSRRSSLA